MKLFLNLIADIQEFYELTLLDESKTVQQKTAETLLIASKWEQENSIKLTEVSSILKMCLCFNMHCTLFINKTKLSNHPLT